MSILIYNDPQWPAFVAQLAGLTDAQLAALCRNEDGLLQASTFMVNAALVPPDEPLTTLRKRVVRAMLAGASEGQHA